MFKTPAVLAAFAVFIVGSASAQVFKCTDGAGKTVYSDAPCSHRAQRLDPNKLRSNTLDGAHDRRAAFQDRVERQAQGVPRPYGPNSAGNASPRSACPSDLEIRNMETSASSTTKGDRERAFLLAEVARARACRQGNSTYSRESWRALEDAQRQQNRINGADRAAARRAAEEIHLGNGSRGVQQGVLQDRANEEARRRAWDRMEREQGGNNIVTSCDSGGCWDAQGRRYNEGGGDILFRQDGKACTRFADQVRCD